MDEKRIDELVMQWEEAFDAGNDLSVEQLCGKERDLIGVVKARIQALKELKWLDKSESDEKTGGKSRKPDEPSVFVPGFVINNRYRIDAIIGQGAFGVVWRGFDLDMQRPVAIKIQKLWRSQSPKKALEPNDEARRMAQLDHRGIVAAYDTVECHGRQIMVSKLVDGITLEEYMRFSLPSTRKALEFVGKLARRIDYAHKHGILHRDIKPSNILIDRQNNLFLTDFGIATTLDPGGQATDEDRRGTLPYMAPELLQEPPGSIDARTDVYSIGVVFYQLLTRQLPYSSKDRRELQQQILKGELQSPCELTDVPADVSDVCLRCLARSPSDRYQSAKQLEEDLTLLSSHRNRGNFKDLGFSVCLILLATIGFGFVTMTGELSAFQATLWLVSLVIAFVVGQVTQAELGRGADPFPKTRWQPPIDNAVDQYLAEVALAKTNHKPQTHRPKNSRDSTSRPTDIRSNAVKGRSRRTAKLNEYGCGGCALTILALVSTLVLIAKFAQWNWR